MRYTSNHIPYAQDSEATYGAMPCCARQVVIVQSTAYDAPHLERRIEAFWLTWRRELEAMSDEEFTKQVTS